MEWAVSPWVSSRCRFCIVVASLALLAGVESASAQRAKGIDVSQFQGTNINWNQVYQGGYVFAFVRASHGSLVDTRFVQNMTGAKNAGLYVGAYHYAVPVDQQYGSVYLYGADPVTDANYFLDSAGARNYITAGYLRPVLDLELGGGQTPVGASSLAAWAVAWLNYVEQQTGVRPFVYCNTNYANNYVNCSVTAFPLWIANWVDTEAESQTWSPPVGKWSTCTPAKTWVFWQWTSSGNTAGYPTVPGIGARVDLDVFNGPASGLQAYVIGATGVITRSPATLSQTARHRTTPADQSFTVRNTGSGTMSYSISTSDAWLQVNPSSGSSAGETDTITVSYAAGGLPIGTYNGTITITSTLATNSPQTIPVALTLTPVPGDLDANGFIDDLDFTLFHGCMTGANQGPPTPGCEGARLDADDDVDQSDFAILQRCFSGSLTLADPSCAP